MQGKRSPQETTTPKQDKLIAALLAGNTIVEAATIAGCNETTAHAWLKLPSVQEAYTEAKHHVFDEALSQLMLDTGEARTTLKAMMKDASVPPNTRVRAAQIILEQAIDIHKVSELEQKIAKLEDLLKDHQT